MNHKNPLDTFWRKPYCVPNGTRGWMGVVLFYQYHVPNGTTFPLRCSPPVMTAIGQGTGKMKCPQKTIENTIVRFALSIQDIVVAAVLLYLPGLFWKPWYDCVSLPIYWTAFVCTMICGVAIAVIDFVHAFTGPQPNIRNIIGRCRGG